MPRKVRELRAELRRAGFTTDPARGKGSHTYWEHPLLPERAVTLAGGNGDDAQRYQERHVRDALRDLRETLAGQVEEERHD